MTQRPILNEQLAAFALGDLGPEESALVRARLAQSPEDRAFVERAIQLVATMRADDSHEPSKAVVHRAVALLRDRAAVSAAGSALRGARSAIQILARLVVDTFAQPTLAGFRGASEVRHLMFQSEAAEIDVQITPREGGPPDARIVRGQVACLDQVSAEAVLWRSMDTAAVSVRTPVGDDGSFLLECGVGSYELSAVLPGTIVRVPTITIT